VEEKLYQNAEWMREKYHTEHLHVDDIAYLAECSSTTVLKWLPKLDISIRECGVFPVYPTEELLRKMTRRNQEIIRLLDWYPNLPILYDDESKLKPFLKRVIRWRRGFWERLSYISQHGNEVVVAQYYREQNASNFGDLRGPQVMIFSLEEGLDYENYIGSEKWRQKSTALREKVGKCQLCGRKTLDLLRTHHNTYENLGQEEEYDLIVLCEDCHRLFHSQKKATSYNRNTWIRITKGDFYAGKYRRKSAPYTRGESHPSRPPHH
jgi:hypothetical protein